ncbi:MAG: hypothetical protein LBI72_03475 [Flavobacteriaceae bacterium]|jgi:hypothetical protein|nr:hypothetical protein [Flavobacteriaceae bacterium]
MIKMTIHTILNKIQQAFIVVCAVWIVFASCSIQTTINHILDEKENVEQLSINSSSKSERQTTVTTKMCQKYMSLDDTDFVVQKAGFDLNNPWVILLLPTVLFLWTAYRKTHKLNKHPLYKSTSDIPKGIPLFIQFENFRI